LLLSLAAAAVWLPAAHAAVPCRDQIYNQWYASGKISTTYPISCYRDALSHIPADAQVYSSLGSDIKRALQAALERKVDPSRVPAQVGSGHALPVVAQTKGAVKTKVSGNQPTTTVALGETSASSDNGLPTIVLVLGGIAVALAATGLIGTGVRYMRNRG
jgi:hypothetical protein